MSHVVERRLQQALPCMHGTSTSHIADSIKTAMLAL
jgi:hypothetical protein